MIIKSNKIKLIKEIQINMVIVWAIEKRSYKIIRQNIKKLVIPTILFYIESLSYKYLSHSIIRYYSLVIWGDYNKYYELSYKIY